MTTTQTAWRQGTPVHVVRMTATGTALCAGRVYNTHRDDRGLTMVEVWFPGDGVTAYDPRHGYVVRCGTTCTMNHPEPNRYAGPLTAAERNAMSAR